MFSSNTYYFRTIGKLNTMNKLNDEQLQIENFLKNQISVITAVIMNFNETIQKFLNR